jgi:two-component system nitrogen regulation response regulator NtrX
MNLEAQAKVLRVIQEGKFERVGSNETINIDVRILAATNKNLEDMIEKGGFREDLFYRLNVIPVTVPPLRDRRSDIPVLLDYYRQYFGHELKTETKQLSEAAVDLLKGYDFPGNVRELKNLMERLYILTSGEIIGEDDVRPQLRRSSGDGSGHYTFLETKDFSEVRKEFEVYYLTRQLEKYDWNISTVAEKLGMAQPNLSRKIKQLDISE